MRNARVIVVVAVLLGAPGVAAAEPVSTEIVKQSVLMLTKSLRDLDPPTAEEKAAIVAGLAMPFWYDGMAYAAVDDASDAAVKRCKKTFKRAGTVKDAAKLTAFVDCLPFAMFSGALDGDAEWIAVDVKKLPRPFKKHKAKLAKLARDHTLVISHFVPAGPAEYWDLWILKHEPSGALRLAGMLVVNDD
jgi:hypothetical protein